ncbi:MAG: polysaccharide deacetylase family protein [Myxococcota bacterium]|nr:polysaccharide deacetylase family protein [Myxococcota bacterium]
MSVIERLGFELDARVVVVHVDDLGMSNAANSGGLEALGGAATCGSVMVPCPAFEAIAATACERPDLDLGVHLTLNAEYDSWRWPPLCEDVPGLASPDGGMWRTTAETVEHARPDEVDRELRAQIDRALAAGIDVTHLDAHMGTVFQAQFVDIYADLARDYRLPVFLPRISREVLERVGAERVRKYIDLIEGLEADGVPVFDHFNADSLSFEPGAGAEHNRARLETLGPGLSYLIIHAAQGGQELSSITLDWRQRDEERRLYSDGTLARALSGGGFRTLGMRPLRDLMRGEAGAS